MKVLSLFDGMACGYIALKNIGVNIERYVAYEIDKYAVQTATHNFPDIEERGDVFDADFSEYVGFDLIVGGGLRVRIGASPKRRTERQQQAGLDGTCSASIFALCVR